MTMLKGLSLMPPTLPSFPLASCARTIASKASGVIMVMASEWWSNPLSRTHILPQFYNTFTVPL